MNEDLERRLREAMQGRADAVEPRGDDGETLAKIQSGITAAHRRQSLRKRGLAVLAVAATIVIIAGGIALAQRDGSSQQVQVGATTSTAAVDTTVAPSSTTTTTPPTTETTSTTAPPPVAENGPPKIWPFDGSGTTFATPEEASLSFAREYLGMGDPQVVGHDALTVDIRPSATGGPVTTVFTLNTDPGYVVTGAFSQDLAVDTPKQGDGLGSPLVVAGQSTAFEATIRVELRPFNEKQQVATTSTMGGSNGDMGPFVTMLSYPGDLSLDRAVLVAIEPDPSGRGDALAATVLSLPGPAAAPQPTITAVTTDGHIVRLDRDGHVIVRGPEATEVAAGGGLTVFGGDNADSPCHRVVGFWPVGGLFTINGSHPALDDNGMLAYADCNTAPAVRDTSGLTTTYEWIGAPVDGITTIGEGDPVVGAAGHLWRYDHRAPTAQPTDLGPGTLPAVRGRYGSVAYFDGTNITSMLVGTDKVTPLFTPPAPPISLDADDAGDTLVWVDTNHDLWTWNDGEPTHIGSGYTAAAL